MVAESGGLLAAEVHTHPVEIIVDGVALLVEFAEFFELYHHLIGTRVVPKADLTENEALMRRGCHIERAGQGPVAHRRQILEHIAQMFGHGRHLYLFALHINMVGADADLQVERALTGPADGAGGEHIDAVV